ncbi:arsenite methyltransferase [Hugenholtzia roseola]|uniref:arsenite methyltransferase n=1 Tax=Hugenholtzia roseola TaxID=1002 RepID=UPI0004105183|nr:arsenite methyltransferase [Hugenholtzia roseola]
MQNLQNSDSTIDSQAQEIALKEMVRERYDRIATQEKTLNAASCCGATVPSNKIYNIMMDDYSTIEGYAQDADLGLGCGLPTEFAHIKEGDTVLDLGSGAGNDCFVARHLTGANGKVIGVDFSDKMLEKARLNVEKLGYNNVEFRKGDIENLPITEASIDVIVSNCVLNLVPNKKAVFSQMYRALKKGGHFSISDVVLVGELPQNLRKDAEMYAGCVSGAIQKNDYLQAIKEAGFENITIQKEKTISIPDDILEKYLSEKEIQDFKKGEVGIFSITVFAQKDPQSEPAKRLFSPKKDTKNANTCAPNSGCC